MASLFEDTSEEEGELDIEVKVDPAYEEKYLERKRREELSRLKDQGIDINRLDESEDSEDEEEDEDAVLLSKDIQKQFYTILPLIRNKDEGLLKSKENFFPAVKPREEVLAKKNKDTKVTLGDVIARDALADQKLNGDEEEKTRAKKATRVDTLTYNEEQEKLRKDFMKSLQESVNGEGDDAFDDDGFLKKRENGKDDESDELAFLQWKESLKKEGKLAEKADVLEKFWNITDDIDDDERFLRDYILNERWREKSEKEEEKRGNLKVAPLAPEEEDEDEEHLEAAEEFETEYNFRYWEDGLISAPEDPIYKV